MIRRTIATMTALFETGMRAAHLTEAATKVGHDWQAVSHGITRPETVFAILIIADTVLRITIWSVRKIVEASKARRERKAAEEKHREVIALGIEPGA